jgi:hypothetical protein
MNYFATIKGALDTSFAGICRHLNVNSKEACRIVAQHLATMSKEWFTGDTPNIAYEDPLCRFAYLYCHTAANANLCEVAIRNSPKVRKFIDTKLEGVEELRVCAFGGGPGTELLAISKHVLKGQRTGHARITFTLLDRVPEWSETWNALEAQINAELKTTYGSFSKQPFSICKTFVPFNMAAASQYANLATLLQQDLYVMNYVVSELIGDHAKFQKLINLAAASAPAGSMFLIVDRDQDRVIQHATGLFSTAGLEVLTPKKTCTNMDSDEQMSALEPYITHIGRNPRVQWGSPRTGRGAFYLVGVKPK